MLRNEGSIDMLRERIRGGDDECAGEACAESELEMLLDDRVGEANGVKKGVPGVEALGDLI